MLPEYTEQITIGNKGFKSYQFSVSWRGDTVTAIVPEAGNAREAFTCVDHCKTKTYYAEAGPGPIYQRQN